MFLEKLKETNPALLKTAFDLIEDGQILPDTYILDLDAITENGRQMLAAARPLHIKMLFMLKQIGRNPLVAQRLMDIGFDGAVAVDYKEALLLARHNIPLGNVGHLVQIPQGAMNALLKTRPQMVTVYSIEKIAEINAEAGRLGIIQPLLLRVSDADSALFSGQQAGFHSAQIKSVIERIAQLPNVSFGGLTVFPALLYNETAGCVDPTDNMKAMQRARQAADGLGYHDYMINIPSCSCCGTLPLIASLGGNCAEPGHGLTGTTPLHRYTNQPEKIGYVYVSEISHNYNGNAYCFGGGEYRRGHLENCLIGRSAAEAVSGRVRLPDLDSIDYHLEIEGIQTVCCPVVMCFRTQMFTTRSHIAVVEGLSAGKPVLRQIYTSSGEPAAADWR